MDAMLPVLPPPPLAYVCYQAVTPPSMDGTLNDPAWQRVPWTADFVDIEGDRKPKPKFRTRAKMIWDKTYLYVAAELQEPHIWATLTQRDSVIFHDNDFELFLDPDDDGQYYAEFEMNALNTVWDLLLPHPYIAGGPAIDGFDLHGLRTAVHVNGAINDPTHPSESWTVNIAIPWTAINQIGRCPMPPNDGDQWRINFSRVEWEIDTTGGKITKKPGPEHNWVWSPQWIIDMHRPEMWGVLQFSTSDQTNVPAKPLDGWSDRYNLFQIWNAEMKYRTTHPRFTESVADLGLTVEGVAIQATTHQFEAKLGNYWIDTNRKLWKGTGSQ
jgi:hypothetical protein